MMKMCARSFVIAGLLAAGSAADAATALRQYGTSAPLRTLAQSARAQDAAADSDAGPALRIVVPGAQGAPQTDAANAAPAAPQFALPNRPAAPALPHVRTGGSRFNMAGARVADGSVGGALGELQYVQIANGMMSVYRKTDGAMLLGPVRANAMFADAPPHTAAAACGAQRGADTAVQFDRLAQRWILSHRAWEQGRAQNGLYYQCIAVSAGADATGSYHRYALALRSAAGKPLYFDDSQLAVWPDAYYFSVNLFDSAAGNYRGPRICGAERKALLRGASAALRCRDLGAGVAPLAPASFQGDADAAHGTAPALLLALDLGADGRGQRLLLWRFSFSANSLAAPVAIAVAPFSIACAGAIACVEQPAPGVKLAAPGERLAPRPVYHARRDTLLAAHTVQKADGRLGLRWYEIRDPFGAAHVHQQGDFAPDQASRWMGSIGMDKGGNIALAYSVAGSDTPPGIGYTGRLHTDPPGRMQAEEIIFNGNGVQTGDARMAPASGALALDPVDGCSFWYTQRYLPSTGPDNWRSRIASFRFEGCR